MPPIEIERKSAYWRSLDELENRPEFQEIVAREFAGRSWDSLPSSTRRSFLKLMAASLALAGLAGCRWPKEEIVPFSRPSGSAPGIPLQYATSMELSGVAQGLLVTSYDGRPIKIEGNPSHPENRGSSDAIAQASLLSLYDPDRSQRIRHRVGAEETTATWEEFSGFLRTRLARTERNGAGIRILSEASTSPTVGRLRRRLTERFSNLVWSEYEAISRDNERIGARLAFGRPVRSHLSLEKAKTIVCLDADPLFSHPTAIRYAGDFADGRRAEQGWMSRLHVIESVYSVTGAMADHRYPVPAGRIESIVGGLAVHLFDALGIASPLGDERTEALLAPYRGDTNLPSFVAELAKELAVHKGASILAVGPRQTGRVHALAHWINAALDNVGTTLRYTAEEEEERPTHQEAIRRLTEEMHSGKVDTLLILGGDPAYDAPAELEFADALAAVETTIHLSLYEDETSRLCRWHLPRAHYLESWGDARAYDGTIGIVQPLIAPLYQGKSTIELLSILLDEIPLEGHELVHQTHREAAGTSTDATAWRTILHDGIVADSAFEPIRPTLRLDRFEDSPVQNRPEGLEIVFCRDNKLYDGRFANNGWLQELPDPITKLTWDNAIHIAPATAESLGLKADDLVTVQFRGRSIELPVFVLPGQPVRSVSVALGYGRSAAGRVGSGVGFDTYKIRTGDALHFGDGVTLEKTGRTYALACTQEHHAIDRIGRKGIDERIGELVREADLETYRKHPDFAQHTVHHPPLVSLWQEPEFGGHQWGMSIDLNACIGCGACVVRC